ncbi:MAG: hypothetical protein ABI983_07150 [Acidobacteriota bacterium]
MATARELLEQVDALMRRNRAEAADASIPVLTEVVAPDALLRADEAVPVLHEAVPVRTEAVPVLADTVTVLETPTIAPVESRGDAARWELLAEDIRMQVLQRIDIFTDTGLQEQLKARLQPIVDRASADLVASINQHVGQLLRTYVAEAIEREIEKWRQGSG